MKTITLASARSRLPLGKASKPIEKQVEFFINVSNVEIRLLGSIQAINIYLTNAMEYGWIEKVDLLPVPKPTKRKAVLNV